MSDLISRQAAIDALIELYEYQMDIDPTEAADLVRQGIYLAEKKIEQLPAAQQEQRWIPCSDENPKADGRYLITGKMGTVYSLDFEDGRWYGGIKPVAWMPLPEPYREDIE